MAIFCPLATRQVEMSIDHIFSRKKKKNYSSSAVLSIVSMVLHQCILPTNWMRLSTVVVVVCDGRVVCNGRCRVMCVIGVVV